MRSVILRLDLPLFVFAVCQFDTIVNDGSSLANPAAVVAWRAQTTLLMKRLIWCTVFNHAYLLIPTRPTSSEVI